MKIFKRNDKKLKNNEISTSTKEITEKPTRSISVWLLRIEYRDDTDIIKWAEVYETSLIKCAASASKFLNNGSIKSKGEMKWDAHRLSIYEAENLLSELDDKWEDYKYLSDDKSFQKLSDIFDNTYLRVLRCDNFFIDIDDEKNLMY